MLPVRYDPSELILPLRVRNVRVQRPLPVHRALKPLQVLLLAGQLYPFAKWQRVASTYVKALAKRRVRLVYVWVPGRIEQMRAQHPVGNWSVSEC